MKYRVMLLKARTAVRIYRPENTVLGIPSFGAMGTIVDVRPDLGAYRVRDGLGRTHLVEPRLYDIETYTDRRYI
jgi:hypothetical protein